MKWQNKHYKQFPVQAFKLFTLKQQENNFNNYKNADST